MNSAILATNGYFCKLGGLSDTRKWLSISGTLAPMSRQNTKAILAKNLRRLMDHSEILDTQIKVAQRAGIAQSTVGRLLRGEVYAQLSQVEALAEAFKVDVAALLDENVDHARGITPEWEQTYTHLSEEEKKQVSDFVAFLAARHQHEAPSTALNTEGVREANRGLTERLVKAIQRELNDDTLNTSHEREHENNPTARVRKRTSTR
ncbi:helix-turn-helix domain-containing protein [Paraburkholderia sp. BR10872]|uniref:helix-turn-helix domain-containing protein n=1 Tax=Paraburkholderia sp. BR10872 TaxID=3236989 RepID=UPI0034D363D1